MHVNSSQSLQFKSIHDDTNGSPSLRAAKPPRVSQDAETLPQNKPVGLPTQLDDYLTVTSKPHEIFNSLQDSRDRRLRLLLRRFTNQIQYGCKTPYCHVTSCLSYRKRHVTTPIRPYSDVAARALAWRCVEQYADVAKDFIADKHGTDTKKRGKSESKATNHYDGLCWNEPVVPWYEDPTHSMRRNRVYMYSPASELEIERTRRPSQGHTAHVKDHHVQDDLHGDNTTGVNGISYTSAHLRDPSQIVSRDVNSLANDTGTTDTSSAEDSKRTATRKSSSKQRHVAFAEPLSEQNQSQQREIKDTASFTQMLYDTISVKNYDFSRPVQRTRHSQDSKDVSETRSRSDQDRSLDAQRRGSHVTEFGTAAVPHVTTFKVLPLSAILWLRSTVLHDVHLSPHRDLDVTPEDNIYTPFIRQSLHFCLTNPSTLLSSAKTWGFIHPQPHKLDEDTRTQFIKKLVSKEQFLTNQQNSHLPRPGGIMVAFGMLIALTSIPEVLGHLFAALQHSYILPTTFKPMQGRDSALANTSRATSTTRGKPHRSEPQTEANIGGNRNDSDQRVELKFIENAQVAQLCMVVVLALQLTLNIKPQSSILARPTFSKDFGEQYLQSRKSGITFPHATLSRAWSDDPDARSKYQGYTSRLDMMDHWSFQRLVDSFADVISHRIAVDEIKKSEQNDTTPTEQTLTLIDSLIEEIREAVKVQDPLAHRQAPKISLINLIDILRSVLLRRWNREAIIRKCGPVGGALELLAALYRNKNDLGISSADFEWAFVTNAFDEAEMPTKWLDFREDNTQTHILSYSFLFQPTSLVTYFRSINSTMMKKSYDSACSVFADARQFLLHNMPLNVYGAKEVLSEIRPNMAKFFVLTIRRKEMLQDAINQIWHRQRQELTRPLKVRLGKDEGEDGLDHGGVQAEFFRFVFAEALNPDYGMFSIDDRTRMTWFQPGSLEPLYKFEVLGTLMSLAVYNGITLPITFPLAFYRKLLGHKVKILQHIKDGWPDLASGLQQLLDWNQGDVGHVIARTYEFGYEAFGASFTVDMTKVDRDDPWPPIERRKSKTASFEFPDTDLVLSLKDELKSKDRKPIESEPISSQADSDTDDSNTSSTPSANSQDSNSATIENDLEAPLVTNANRQQYVKDYIYWLTNKSISAQFSSFADGFFTCLDRTALSMFTPEHLKVVIEGHQHIDIDGLQATTTYDEYKSTDDVIQWFWQVVRNMSPEQHKRLLEFVTASDRVPVNGIASVVFIIQRNGEGSERLPSSSTCYGRLLLPRYTTKEVLKEKLEKAIENSAGFGSL